MQECELISFFIDERRRGYDCKNQLLIDHEHWETINPLYVSKIVHGREYSVIHMQGSNKEITINTRLNLISLQKLISGLNDIGLPSHMLLTTD